MTLATDLAIRARFWSDEERAHRLEVLRSHRRDAVKRAALALADIRELDVLINAIEGKHHGSP